MTHIPEKYDESVLNLHYNIKNNAMSFHKMMEDIKPKIHNYILKLLDSLNISIKIKRNNHKQYDFYSEYKKYCEDAIIIVNEVYDNLMNFIKMNNNMVTTFVRKPKHSSKAFRVTFRKINCWHKYHHWFCYIINISLGLPSICNKIKQYLETLVIFQEKYHKYNELLFRDVEYEYDFIYNLQNYLLNISDIDNFCTAFTILSTAQYKDMYNLNIHNRFSFYIGSYFAILYELDRIRDQPDYNENLLFFERKIKDINEKLSKYWSIYISVVNEQRAILTIVSDIESDYSKLNSNRNKISILKCILQNYINNSIDNSIINISNLIKVFLDITQKYNKKCKNYIKVMKDFNNFIDLIFS